MIGAQALSDKAAGLEAAAKAGDGDTVRAGHDELLREYETVAQAIRAAVPETASGEEESDILEFPPDSN